MFVSDVRRPDGGSPALSDPDGSPDPRQDKVAARDALRARGRTSLTTLAERVRPVSTSSSRVLPVPPFLADLLPEGGLRRGSTLVVDGPGPVGLACALLSDSSAAGSWCAMVGIEDPGAAAIHTLGLDLARTVFVPNPGPAWAEATAHLLDGIDLVVLRPPFPPRGSMARRLVARARERRSVLIVVPGGSRWPEPPDVRLTIQNPRWTGVASGEGYLRGRHVTVEATGRRSAARARTGTCWLPGAHGSLEAPTLSGMGPSGPTFHHLDSRTPVI